MTKMVNLLAIRRAIAYVLRARSHEWTKTNAENELELNLQGNEVVYIPYTRHAYLSPAFYEELCIQAITQDHTSIQIIPTSFLCDYPDRAERICTSAIRKTARTFRHIPRRFLIENPAIAERLCIEAISLRPKNIAHVPHELFCECRTSPYFSNPKILFTAIENDPSLIRHAPAHVRTSDGYAVRRALCIDGLVLEHIIDPSLSACIIAVRQNFRALAYVPNALYHRVAILGANNAEDVIELPSYTEVEHAEPDYSRIEQIRLASVEIPVKRPSKLSRLFKKKKISAPIPLNPIHADEVSASFAHEYALYQNSTTNSWIAPAVNPYIFPIDTIPPEASEKAPTPYPKLSPTAPPPVEQSAPHIAPPVEQSAPRIAPPVEQSATRIAPPVEQSAPRTETLNSERGLPTPRRRIEPTAPPPPPVRSKQNDVPTPATARSTSTTQARPEAAKEKPIRYPPPSRPAPPIPGNARQVTSGNRGRRGAVASPISSSASLNSSRVENIRRLRSSLNTKLDNNEYPTQK